MYFQDENVRIAPEIPNQLEQVSMRVYTLVKV